MNFDLIILPGDGVGPEVTAEAIKVLVAVGETFGHRFDFHYDLVGGAAIDHSGTALTAETLRQCKRCDAVLLGAVGGPKWDDPLAKVRPEDGLLELRKELKLFANLRPVKVYPMLVDSTPLKPSVIQGVDCWWYVSLPVGFTSANPRNGGRPAEAGALWTAWSTPSKK